MYLRQIVPACVLATVVGCTPQAAPVAAPTETPVVVPEFTGKAPADGCAEVNVSVRMI